MELVLRQQLSVKISNGEESAQARVTASDFIREFVTQLKGFNLCHFLLGEKCR